MASQRKISQSQGFEIEIADNAGIGPKAAQNWLAFKLVAQLISVTLFKTTKTIYEAGDGIWSRRKHA
jgi:hypothetical protein